MNDILMQFRNSAKISKKRIRKIQTGVFSKLPGKKAKSIKRYIHFKPLVAAAIAVGALLALTVSAGALTMGYDPIIKINGKTFNGGTKTSYVDENGYTVKLVAIPLPEEVTGPFNPDKEHKVQGELHVAANYEALHFVPDEEYNALSPLEKKKRDRERLDSELIFSDDTGRIDADDIYGMYISIELTKEGELPSQYFFSKSNMSVPYTYSFTGSADGNSFEINYWYSPAKALDIMKESLMDKFYTYFPVENEPLGKVLLPHEFPITVNGEPVEYEATTSQRNETIVYDDGTMVDTVIVLNKFIVPMPLEILVDENGMPATEDSDVPRTITYTEEIQYRIKGGVVDGVIDCADEIENDNVTPNAHFYIDSGSFADYYLDFQYDMEK